MRARILHMMCAALLTVGPHLLLQSCASSEETEDGDLAGEQNAEGSEEASNETNNATEEGQEVVNNTEMAEGNGAEENLANEGEAEEAPADNQVLEGDQTKSDLEEIIAGQNADASAAPVNAAPVNAVPTEAAPVDATAAAAPVAAPAMAAGPALPEQGSKMPYIVRVGETLSSIAKTIYGSTEKWTEMAELSAIKNPNLVRPGDVIYYQLGQETLAFATAYEGAGRTELTVQRGDTLAGIAQRVYGNQGDWKYVWRQNANIEDPDRLEVGMTIYYLSPGSLQAALDYARSITLADLLKTFQQPKNENVNTEVPAQASNSMNQATSLTGFEIAASMFQAFTTNFATAG